MSIRFTVTLSGAVPLPEQDGIADYRITNTAERPREAIESAGRRARFARRALHDALSVARPALRHGLKGGVEPRAADRRPVATWSRPVDIEGRLVARVATEQLHPGIGGVISFRVEPEKTTAVLVGHGWELTVGVTRAQVPGGASEQPVAAALAGVRALRVALEQPLPELGRLWRALGRLPAVGGGHMVEVRMPPVRVEVSCAVVPYAGKLLRIGPHWYGGGFEPEFLIDDAPPGSSPIDQVLAWEEGLPTGSLSERWHALVGGPLSVLEDLADAHWRLGTRRTTRWERLFLATVGVRHDRMRRAPNPAASVRALVFRAHLRAAFLGSAPAELIVVVRDPSLVREVERSAGFLRLLGRRPRIVHREVRDELTCLWLWPGFPRRGEQLPRN